MYCPKCGSEGQETKTYCRQCGDYLPDFEGANRPEKTPAQRFKLSLVFNLLSAFAGISMAIALFVVYAGRTDTHPVIFAAISLFFVISTWQIVSFFNNLKLRRRFVRDRKNVAESSGQDKFSPAETRELLSEGDYSNYVAASVTEGSTRNLGEKIPISSNAKEESD